MFHGFAHGFHTRPLSFGRLYVGRPSLMVCPENSSMGPLCVFPYGPFSSFAPLGEGSVSSLVWSWLQKARGAPVWVNPRRVCRSHNCQFDADHILFSPSWMWLVRVMYVNMCINKKSEGFCLRNKWGSDCLLFYVCFSSAEWWVMTARTHLEMSTESQACRYGPSTWVSPKTNIFHPHYC